MIIIVISYLKPQNKGQINDIKSMERWKSSYNYNPTFANELPSTLNYPWVDVLLNKANQVKSEKNIKEKEF